MRAGLMVVGVLASLGVAAVLLGRRRTVSDPADPSNEERDPGEKTVPKQNDSEKLHHALVAGERTDPAVAPVLAELQSQLTAAGVTRFTAVDLTVMSKAPLTDGPDPDHDKTRPLAIPPYELWPGLITISQIVQSIADSKLSDLELRFTGYRPADYNKSVGGAPDSQHIHGDAIDVWLGKNLIASGDSAKIKAARQRLFTAFASYWVTHPSSPLGFGVYTNDIHFDVGGRRTWKNAQREIQKVTAVS